MGASKYTSRSELLRLKKTGVAGEVDAATQRLFDAGHAAERAAMPIAERIIGETLYPLVGTSEVDGLPLLASLDGATIEGDVIWENKLLNAALVEMIEAGELSWHYWAQLEHQLLVSGAERALFTASDGTEAGTKHLWYVSYPDRRAAVLAAWKQFHADLAGFELKPATVSVAAPPMAHLPAVSVQMNGALSVVSNLAPFGDALRAFVARIPARPNTDEEFALTEAACKRLKDAEDALNAAESGALASISDVELMRRMVGELRELARVTRLAGEKMVKTRKEEIRGEILHSAQASLDAHAAALNDRLGSPWLPRTIGPFSDAIKGLKSVDSIKNAADTALANAKIAASARADLLERNRKALTIDGKDWFFLFADFSTSGSQAAELFDAVAGARIKKHMDEQAAESRRRADALAATVATSPAPTPATSPPPRPAPAPIAPADDAPATFGVGGVNIHFGPGITMNAQFIEDTLGVKRDGEDPKRKTPMWRGSSINKIAAALSAYAGKMVEQ
jgi:predicted phage-related endonuclease